MVEIKRLPVKTIVADRDPQFVFDSTDKPSLPTISRPQAGVDFVQHNNQRLFDAIGAIPCTLGTGKRMYPPPLAGSNAQHHIDRHVKIRKMDLIGINLFNDFLKNILFNWLLDCDG